MIQLIQPHVNCDMLWLRNQPADIRSEDAMLYIYVIYVLFELFIFIFISSYYGMDLFDRIYNV